jgi:teichoic acid transport system ATP-binding protein
VDEQAEQKLKIPAVVLKDAHVTYRVYENSSRRIQDLIHHRSRRRVLRHVHALGGIDLTVNVGEAVALIGHNGAGKSTLLRAIAGLQPLDAGSLKVATPPQLLGVQSILKGSWSGRQSIETGLIALGLTRSEALERVEAVIEFARLGDAIDLPTATYSSGMRARLHFAISTEVNTGILLIDEALSAGDGAFRKVAEQRLHQRIAESETLILVSHSMNTVRELCDRAVLVESGRVISDGNPDEVIATYERLH